MAELALTRTSTGSSTATLTQLKFVSAYVEVSSLSYFPSPPLRQDMDQGHWPKSFLGANLKVAVGSVDGQFALLQAGSCRAVHELFKPSEGVSQEVISLVTWLPFRYVSVFFPPKRFAVRGCHLFDSFALCFPVFCSSTAAVVVMVEVH